MFRKQEVTSTVGLVLSGGGARGAYQVGVLKAIADTLPRDASIPFRVICGTSAGAINATVLATLAAENYRTGVLKLERVWRNFTADKVYRTDLFSLMRCAYHWLGPIIFRGLSNNHASSLLDNTPLRLLLKKFIDFNVIQQSINHDYLDALSITASSYRSGESITFFQGKPSLSNWRRSRRVGQRDQLTLQHLMASAAIPVLFPAEAIDGAYYCDGAIRQTSPISPALHLGADKIMAIGVRDKREPPPPLVNDAPYPSIAATAGHFLNTVFLDSLDADIERLERINETVKMIPQRLSKKSGLPLKQIGLLKISPSEPLDAIAREHVQELPKTLRFFFGRTGGLSSGGASFMSYLLFEKGFTRQIMDLGYYDAIAKRDEIKAFLQIG